jgi:hypothetical protein
MSRKTLTQQVPDQSQRTLVLVSGRETLVTVEVPPHGETAEEYAALADGDWGHLTLSLPGSRGVAIAVRPNGEAMVALLAPGEEPQTAWHASPTAGGWERYRRAEEGPDDPADVVPEGLLNGGPLADGPAGDLPDGFLTAAQLAQLSDEAPAHPVILADDGEE